MSTALDALLAGRVYEGGQALRRTTLRHMHLTDQPLAIVVWRLGGERFRAAAVAWGPVGEPFKLAVAGEPRNRDLYFAALLPFARDLCEHVRRCAEKRERWQRGSLVTEVPIDALQLVVANRATVAALGLLGRYLGYLSDRDGVTPDPALVEAGRHLRFYTRQARVPGQALIVPLDRLVSQHWATLLSPLEQANLAVLDAQIEPPRGLHAFDASVLAEQAARIGPEPTEDIDRDTADLLEKFNEARGRSTDPAVVRRLVRPLQAHYRGLVDPVWNLMDRVLERERALPKAPSATARFAADRAAFGRHVDWVTGGGRYRTTDTPRQAAMTLRRLEEAQQRYEAERALEDPACMVPHLLDGDAIQGTVASCAERQVVARVNRVRRAVIEIDTDDPVVLPAGKRLWWTVTAGDKCWEVQSVASRGTGCRVTLMLTAAPTPARLPAVGARVVFSTLKTAREAFSLSLPQNPPWTHAPEVVPPPPEVIDAGDGEDPPAAVDGATVPDPTRFA